MTRVPTREERLYRLNGRLASIMRQLGSAIGESRMICDASDNRYMKLSQAYEIVKETANGLHKRYLE